MSQENTLSPVYFHGLINSTCGYCKKWDTINKKWKKDKTSFLVSFTTYKNFSPFVYQKLLNRGWTRSGSYVYQPQNSTTCCPQYGLRLDVTKLKLTSKQEKAFKKWNNYLNGKDEKKEIKKKEEISFQKDFIQCIDQFLKDENLKTEVKYQLSFSTLKKTKQSGDISTSIGINLSKILKKDNPKDISLAIIKLFNDKFLQNYKEILKISVEDNGYINIFTENKKKEKVKKEVKKRKFHMDLCQAKFDETTFKLYQKYQSTIHKENMEDITVNRYDGFLVETPIENAKNDKFKDSKIGMTYGTFHLKYYLEDNLIGVSVLDILPEGIESVYFYYDPDYSFLSLGSISAILETQMVLDHYKMDDTFKYYYFGYYVPTCPKMQYKVDWFPSELLDPVVYEWVPVEKIITELKKKKYMQFVNKDAKKESMTSALTYHGSTMSQEALQMMVFLRETTKSNIKIFQNTLGKDLNQHFSYLITDEMISFEKEEITTIFGGEGKVLQEKKIEEVVEEKPFEYKLDETQASTSIQIRFHDGSRLAQKFNLNDKVEMLFKFVESSKKVKNFELILGHTRKPIVEKDKSFEELGVKNSVVIQNLK